MEPIIDPSQVEYARLVRKQIELLNEILHECDAPGIFENPYITFDNWWVSENCLKFRIFREDNISVLLDFYLEGDGMRIDVEGYPESREFPEKEILEKSEVRKLLIALLCCPVLVERKGKAMFVNLFNPDGSKYAIWSLQSFGALITMGYWKSLRIDQHLHSPIYRLRDK